MLSLAEAWMSIKLKTAITRRTDSVLHATGTSSSSSSSFSWFSTPKTTGSFSSSSSGSTLEKRKAVLLQLGAALDRGQAYNPTSGEYYKDRMDVAVSCINDFVRQHSSNVPVSLPQIAGEWELVLITVPHGIFRSSPFFLAIQEAYETWGISKIGRVAQHITVDTNQKTGNLYSEFDTSIFSLTVIPILGWFKLLPTFGGCVVTATTCELQSNGVLQMKVDYTSARPVPGLQGLGDWIWKVRVPVGAIWKRLPWNKGRDAVCKVFVRYVDDDFRIVQDVSGDYFVYTRPVVPRPLDLVEE